MGRRIVQDTGRTAMRTLYANGEPVAINRYDTATFTGGTVYLGKDLMGSVRGTTNDYGLLEDRYEYDAFGKPYKGDLNGGMNLGYTGKPYDTATGMYNYGYRDYQPEVARFTTVDPIRDGSNWFAYVNNDPVNWIDPLGLQCISANDPKNNWIDNGNGTYTAKPGATLLGLYGSDWQEQSGFTRDPRTLQIGETVGTPTLPTPSPTPVPAPKAPAAPVPTPVVPAPTAYTVTAIASGIGANVSIGAGRVEVIGAELVSVSFSVAETGQLFTSSYHSVVEARGGISISASVYYTSLESHKTFPAGTTPEYIANDYAGTSTFVGVSIGPFSISGSEDNGWSTSGVSVGPGWGASLITGDVITTTYIDGSLKVVR